MNAIFARARRRTQRRKGLTLIELVMVLIILTALAAMIVPIIDNIRRTSDKSTASAVMKQLVENVSLYRTQKGVYPNDFDSLLDEDGLTAATSLGKSGKGIASPLSTLELEGLTGIGITRVMDLDVDNSTGNVYRARPGNSGVVPRLLSDDPTVYVLTNADIVGSIYPEEVAGTSGSFDATTGTITKANGTKVRLVALGVGPSCDAVGQTMQSPPAYSGVTNPEETYNRFIAIFAVYENTAGRKKRAQLKGALDSTFDFLNQELNEVEENTIE